MRHKKAEKKWGAIFLAGVVSMGMFLQPLSAYATSSSVLYGTYHIDKIVNGSAEYAGYDINAEVMVEDGTIANVTITGENYADATFALVNGSKLTSAINGIVDKIIGLADTDVDGINAIDTVSGATYSSDGIKAAVINALEQNKSEDGDTRDITITANIDNTISAPSYTVTVPNAIAMGTLSAAADNRKAYGVSVEAAGLNGTLSISAAEKGELVSGSNVLAFANSFGTQTVTADTAGTKLNGEISVTAADVAAAAAGNYVGTTTFSITYTAN